MYNNPYNFYPYMNNLNSLGGIPNLGRSAIGASAIRATRPSLFNSIRSIKWGSILTNTQKTLNVINQAIPVYYQIKPIASNLRNFGKIMSAFNTPDNSNTITNNNSNNIINTETKKEDVNGLPTFFID